MFSTSSAYCLAFIFFFLLVKLANLSRVQFVEPRGSTGCSKKFSPVGWCWRYCAGNSGKWCYTATGCLKSNEEENDFVCDDKSTCGGFCQSNSAGDCVNNCDFNTLPFMEEYSTKPIGATGCSRRVFENDLSSMNGSCWGYCQGTAGDWCYTSRDCISYTEQCAGKTECGDYSCTGASARCVVQCQHRGPHPPGPAAPNK